MNKDIKKELLEMKYLFGYERGRVISEQSLPMDEDNNMEGEYSGISDAELDEEMNLDTLEMGENTKEKERTKVTPGTKEREKTKSPSTPYKPKPGPKPDPKARKRKGDMPHWLTFDELGINFE